MSGVNLIPFSAAKHLERARQHAALLSLLPQKVTFHVRNPFSRKCKCFPVVESEACTMDFGLSPSQKKTVSPERLKKERPFINLTLDLGYFDLEIVVHLGRLTLIGS